MNHVNSEYFDLQQMLNMGHKIKCINLILRILFDKHKFSDPEIREVKQMIVEIGEENQTDHSMKQKIQKLGSLKD